MRAYLLAELAVMSDGCAPGSARSEIRGTNTRINDTNARVDGLREDTNARLAGTNTVDDLDRRVGALERGET